MRKKLKREYISPVFMVERRDVEPRDDVSRGIPREKWLIAKLTVARTCGDL